MPELLSYELLYTISCGETCLFWAYTQDEHSDVAVLRLPLHMPPHIAQLFPYALSQSLGSFFITPWSSETTQVQRLFDLCTKPQASLYIYDFVSQRPLLFAQANFEELFSPEIIGFNLVDTIEKVFVHMYEMDPNDARIDYMYGSRQSLLLALHSGNEFVGEKNEKYYQTVLYEIQKFWLRTLFFTSMKMYDKGYLYTSQDVRDFIEANGLIENAVHFTQQTKVFVQDINTIFDDEVYSVKNCLKEMFQTFRQYFLCRALFCDLSEHGKTFFFDNESGQFVKPGFESGQADAFSGTSLLNLTMVD